MPGKHEVRRAQYVTEDDFQRDFKNHEREADNAADRANAIAGQMNDLGCAGAYHLQTFPRRDQCRASDIRVIP